MALKDDLLILFDRYCAASGLSRSRVSTLIFNGGHVVGRLDGGGDLTTGSFEHALQWFSDNWPADTVWPAGIARPPKTEAAA